jgi:hypothetical protein
MQRTSGPCITTRPICSCEVASQSETEEPAEHAINRPLVTMDARVLLSWIDHSELETLDVLRQVIFPGDTTKSSWPSEDQANGVVGVCRTRTGTSNRLSPVWEL